MMDLEAQSTGTETAKPVEPHITVVVPVYNNETSIKELTQLLNSQAEELGLSTEIIYINDASRDRSRNILRELSKQNPQLKLIDHEVNEGQQKSILKGISLARGECIVVMDADLQDRPELIGPLYSSITGPDQVAFVLRKGIYQSFERMLTSNILKLLVRGLTGLHHKAGTYYIFHRSLLPKLWHIAESCPFPYTSIMVNACAGSVDYVPGVRFKGQGKSSYSFKRRLKTAYTAVRCSFYCGKLISESFRMETKASDTKPAST